MTHCENNTMYYKLLFIDQVKVLRGHTSMVKGVTWDPIGKYVATQSDDKTLIVWRTSDWLQEKTISEPFKEAGGTTHALRLGWSPDGSYMVRLLYLVVLFKVPQHGYFNPKIWVPVQ